MNPSPGVGRPLLVDAHVHLHDCFAVDEFLDCAAANIRAAGRQLGAQSSPLGLLLFTDPAGSDSIERLRVARRAGSLNGWMIGDTAEECSLHARREGDPELSLIAGRQIATADGLEVLALGCPGSVPDGLGLEETIGRVRRRGAIAVVPWGFGKWWFSRGRLLERIVEDAAPPDLFLGDNSGRLRWSRTPRQFRHALARGLFVLPGSDPLPFPAQVGKVGSYGLILDGEPDRARPAAGVRELLARMDGQPDSYGRLERILPFVRNQLAMQLHKRTTRSRRAPSDR